MPLRIFRKKKKKKKIENTNMKVEIKKLDEISHCKRCLAAFPQAPRGPPAIFLISTLAEARQTTKKHREGPGCPRCSSKAGYPFSPLVYKPPYWNDSSVSRIGSRTSPPFSSALLFFFFFFPYFFNLFLLFSFFSSAYFLAFRLLVAVLRISLSRLERLGTW